MRKKAIIFIMVSTLIAGCGSGTDTMLTPGNQVTGKAAARAVVYLKDSAGAEVSTEADAAGSYLVNTIGMSKPFMLKAVFPNTSSAYAVAPSAGKTDIDAGSSNLVKLVAVAADLAVLWLTVKADILLIIAGTMSILQVLFAKAKAKAQI